MPPAGSQPEFTEIPLLAWRYDRRRGAPPVLVREPNIEPSERIRTEPEQGLEPWTCSLRVNRSAS